MKTDITFDSAGLKLAGHLYTPDDKASGPGPAIVVGHPGSGVKEQAADLYAKRWPRGIQDPAHRIEDIKAAVRSPACVTRSTRIASAHWASAPPAAT